MSRTLLVALMFVVSTVEAGELALTQGGARIIDRDPATTSNNCLGWVFAPSPVTDASGEVVAMYTASDALTNRCKAAADPAHKFGDRIRLHRREPGGGWSGGVDVIDRSSFSWMADEAFLAQRPESFVAHLASPSVVKEDGRYYMAFVGSVDDRNLCAGEHFAENICGSCFDPWSYFVLMWAVSDDGITWRVRERAPGDATLIGRPPDASEREASSLYKGLTRVSLVTHEEKGRRWFYFGSQFWTKTGIKIGMFRVERDASDAWGITGEPEVWNAATRQWVTCTGGRVPEFFVADGVGLQNIGHPLSSIARVGGQYIALTTHGAYPYGGRSRWSQVVYYTSTNLVDWGGGFLIPSAIPYVADGFSYEVSVIDPVAVPSPDGRLRLFFASADGDERNGVDRDGRHDCELDPRSGPTAPYVGTGIYEATLEYVERRPTRTVIQAARNTFVAGESMCASIRVVAEDGSTPQGVVAITDGQTFYQQARLSGGKVDIAPFVAGGAGPREVWATYSSDGIWAWSRSEPIRVNVVAPTKKRAVSP